MSTNVPWEFMVSRWLKKRPILNWIIIKCLKNITVFLWIFDCIMLLSEVDFWSAHKVWELEVQFLRWLHQSLSCENESNNSFSNISIPPNGHYCFWGFMSWKVLMPTWGPVSRCKKDIFEYLASSTISSIVKNK